MEERVNAEKKFYDFSMENDPDLTGPTWNTKNFEFSCIRPETLQRAIEKVHSDAGASLKDRKSHLLSKFREKIGGGENLMCSQDAQVETNISQTQQFGLHELDEVHNKTRQMSDGDKASSGDSSHSHSDASTTKTDPAPFKSIKSTSDSGELQEVTPEEYQEPKPKWVEVLEPEKATMQMFNLSHQPILPPPPYGYPVNMYGQMPYPYMTPSPQMMQAAGYVYNPQNMMENYGYQNIYTDYDPRAHLVEDSDLEDELLRREHYTKYCEKRPDIDETHASDENGNFAEFVKIAPQEPYTDMSFLKSNVPMRYSELSEDETQEETLDQDPKVIIKRQSAFKEKIQVPRKNLQKPTTNKDLKKKEKTVKAKSSIEKYVAQEKMLSDQHSQCAKTTTNRRHSKYSPSIPAAQAKRKGTSQNRVPQESSPSIQDYQKIVLITPRGKSIEQLKTEKVAIFNKMSRSHERLIEALQQLRTKLLEVHVPESNSDRNRRNKNGLEFSVRFLRNFLYPLKGMIDALRNTPRGQFNSTLSNDACNRVSHIYSLFLQAVLTYSKQLRHFMIDQVPQKLTTLLEMLFSTTNMCLEKRLFDRNDAIVEYLLKQCSDFLAFLEDLHAQRFVAAREYYSKNSIEHHQYVLKMFMNDLNMYEPKLVPKRTATNHQRSGSNRKAVVSQLKNPNSQQVTLMQAVPQPPRRLRKRVKQMKTIPKKNCDGPLFDGSEIDAPKRPEQDIQTQVQKWEQLPRSSETDEPYEVLENLQTILQQTPDLDKYKKIDTVKHSILNALKNAQHHQTREVLQPLLKSINDILDVPEDDNKIENILKAFQIKISIALNNNNFIHASSGKDFKENEIEHHDLNKKKECLDRFEEESELIEEQSAVESENVPRSQNYCAVNNPYEEEDDDGQFYISGEDNSEKRTTHSRKSKVEPLIEIVNESENAELYLSDTELYTPFGSKRHQQDSKFIDMILNPTKTSPYDIPVSRVKQKSQKKLKSAISQTTTKSSSNKISHSEIPVSVTSKPLSSKLKPTTVPPSPAMMRLKQLANTPCTTELRKRNNLLKKRTRRNPLGSPPPVPAVSPSTSTAATASTNDKNSELRNKSSSHKGCSTNMSNGKVVGSSELSHRPMTHSSTDINSGSVFKVDSNNSSQCAPQQPSSHKFGNNKSNDAFQSVELRAKENRLCEKDENFGSSGDCLKNEKCQPGESKDDNTEKPFLCHETSQYGKNEERKDKTDKKNFKIDFDEDSLLKERDQFLSLCIRNRLYTNPSFPSPWKIFARLSEQLTNEVVEDVESDFNSGVLNFVDDFLKLETRI